MRKLGGIVTALGLASLAGCATAPPPAPESAVACPVGQEARRTAQLFFGRNVSDKPGVSEADFQAFVDKDLTPRFPDGLTVLDGGGQWRGAENKLIREASKVVLIVLPKGRDVSGRIDTVRNVYKARFHQDSVLLITQAACVSF
ncbi:DUF3574 domain-containing protein [Phenylobacterium sp.]|uniref:DUF3574 domain-containing protein n=1 Tax=Phenylobacterium sp. TaxID=1871053 RepID=UPI00120E24BE|nr:DUF3574 domain-containing protein [Phenylobacterium sp.]THD52023.1 MAG: DUF3574 domain-containing protein [Phenylobacterium sp.]